MSLFDPDTPRHMRLFELMRQEKAANEARHDPGREATANVGEALNAFRQKAIASFARR